jgi:hypothetical protein
MADLDVQITTNAPKIILEVLGVMNLFENKIQTRLTNINQILLPDGPPIEPQLQQALIARLRTLRDSAGAINALATQTITHLDGGLNSG